MAVGDHDFSKCTLTPSVNFGGKLLIVKHFYGSISCNLSRVLQCTLGLKKLILYFVCLLSYATVAQRHHNVANTSVPTYDDFLC